MRNRVDHILIAGEISLRAIHLARVLTYYSQPYPQQLWITKAGSTLAAASVGESHRTPAREPRVAESDLGR
jgi:hypothetical protein